MSVTLTPITSGVSLMTVSEYVTITGSTSSESRLTTLIGAASAAIMQYCNFRMVAESRDEYLSGEGFNFLHLGAKPLTLTALTENPENNPVSIDVSDLSWSDTGRLYFKPDASRTAFEIGYRNYRVQYTSYGTIDDDMKLACAIVAHEMEQGTDVDHDVLEKRVGQEAVKFSDKYVKLSDPVFSRARELLAPYRRFLCV